MLENYYFGNFGKLLFWKIIILENFGKFWKIIILEILENYYFGNFGKLLFWKILENYYFGNFFVKIKKCYFIEHYLVQNDI